MRYVLKIAYDGTHFCGWQEQPNGISVQSALSEAAWQAFGIRAVFTASGRTDSGVHALGQVCHVDMDVSVPPEKLADALNCRLPSSVSVLSSAAAPEGFDANRSAKKKTYVYRMYNSPRRNPLKDRYSVHIRGAIDIDAMHRAAQLFVGEHDFKAYCASRSQVKTTVRTVYSFNAEQDGEDITLSVCGNGFLYNMVRTLAGTVLGCAQGVITCERVLRSLDEGDRSLAGRTMPPNGLCLTEVDYGTALFER